MNFPLPKTIKNLIKNTFFYKLYLNYQYKKNEKTEITKNYQTRGPFIDKFFPKNGIGAELGVLKGNFSRVLLEKSQAKELHLIDPWYFLGPHWHWAGDNTSTIDALCKILQAFKKEISEKKVFVHVQDDIRVLKSFPDEYFDWVYIDSSHAYEHTMEELIILKDKVKKQGVIGGDDWRPSPNHRHHGVFKAVKEFMERHDYQLVFADENNLQWFIRKNEV